MHPPWAFLRSALQGIIQVSNGRFADDTCTEYRFAGYAQGRTARRVLSQGRLLPLAKPAQASPDLGTPSRACSARCALRPLQHSVLPCLWLAVGAPAPAPTVTQECRPTHPPAGPTTAQPCRWNGWNLLRHAVQDPSYLTQKFQQAQDSSLSVVRFFLMGGDDDGTPPLLSSPGLEAKAAARNPVLGEAIVRSAAPDWHAAVRRAVVPAWYAPQQLRFRRMHARLPLRPACTPPVATATDQLNEKVARGLDFVLAEAAKYGIKATIAFLNLWKPSGVPQFEEW